MRSITSCLAIAIMCLLEAVTTSAIPDVGQGLDASGVSKVPGEPRQQDTPKDPLKLPGWASRPLNLSSPHPLEQGKGNLLQPAPITFGGACMDVHLKGNGAVGRATIDGRCVDVEGIWWDTALNLNHCVANKGGSLEFRPDGHFDKTCRPCKLANHGEIPRVFLKCECQSLEGDMEFTVLHMGHTAHNSLAVKPIDGRFVCGSVNGTRAPASYS